MAEKVERRAYDRADLSDGYVPVMYRGRDQTSIQGEVHDISKGGMFVITDAKGKVGASVTAYIDFESLVKVVLAHGRIVRESPEGIGIVFTESDQEGIEDIMELHRRKV